MLEKTFWVGLMVNSLLTALGTMHRMPVVSMLIGVLYVGFVFRRRMRL